MDILSTARRLESALSARLDRVAERVRAPGPREPLELAHAIVESVARHIEPGGRGRYLFPFTHVKITLLAGTRAARARLAAVLEGDPSIADRIDERLRSAGCASAAVDVRTHYVAEPGTDWACPEFHVDLQRISDRSRPPAPPGAGRGTVRLTVEHGKAEKASYSFASERVNLGRCADVRDSRNRLLRTNHVAVVDGGGDANDSVSRQHAHISYDPATAHHRLCDDGSAQGTSIVRAGRIIRVPPGARGIRMQSGDVLVLGDVRLRVTLPE